MKSLQKAGDLNIDVVTHIIPGSAVILLKSQVFMSALIALGIRLLIVYIVVQLVLMLMPGKKKNVHFTVKKDKPKTRRFDTKDKNVVDGEFKEI